MDELYINQKVKDILIACEVLTLLDQRKKLIKLILENIWLAGKVEAMHETIESIR